MKTRQAIVLILCIFIGSTTQADENNQLNLFSNSNNTISYSSIDDDWIKVDSTINQPSFTLKSNNDFILGDELAFAWNFSESLSFNLSVFENQSNSNYIEDHNSNFINKPKSFNKYIASTSTNDVNRNISGYKLGISSKLAMGKNYIVNINLDYGQLDEANLVGFYNSKVNTSSFELGIRKSKFGASFLTDSYLENNTDILNHTRLGFELDWYLSDDTIISFGSKQRYTNKTYIDQSQSLDALTGNVQYIKFQLNL